MSLVKEMNMFRNFVMVALIFLFSTSFLLQAEEDEDIGAILQDSLIISDTCTDSPCLFGQSLQGMSYNQVHQLISVSDMRDNLVLIDSPMGTIYWLWSSEIAPVLGVPAYSEILTEDEYNHINEFNGFNSISFHNGLASSVGLGFETQLSVLVEIYGEPVMVDPLSYNRFGDLTFQIFFPNIEGYFTAYTQCDNPELVASTRILRYTSTVDDPFISDEVVEWQGYTDELPDCTTFQP